MICDFCDDQLLKVGMEKLSLFVDRVVGGDFICGSRLYMLLPDFGHVFEF